MVKIQKQINWLINLWSKIANFILLGKCSGYGSLRSICVWASWIRILNYLYRSGSLSLKNDVNVLQKVIIKTKIFLASWQSPKKRAGSGNVPYRTKISRSPALRLPRTISHVKVESASPVDRIYVQLLETESIKFFLSSFLISDIVCLPPPDL